MNWIQLAQIGFGSCEQGNESLVNESLGFVKSGKLRRRLNMHQCIEFILFWNDTLHVSDRLSVHHHEFKTVHTATGICLTDTAVCSLASRLLMMDGKTVRNM